MHLHVPTLRMDPEGRPMQTQLSRQEQADWRLRQGDWRMLRKLEEDWRIRLESRQEGRQCRRQRLEGSQLGRMGRKGLG